MGIRNTLIWCSIEGVGSLLILASLVHAVLSGGTFLMEIPHIVLPVIFGGGIVVFGRYLRRQESVSFDARQRGIIAGGHVVGGLVVGLITAWILLIVGLEYGFPDEIAHILLNGASIGALGGGSGRSVCPTSPTAH